MFGDTESLRSSCWILEGELNGRPLTRCVGKAHVQPAWNGPGTGLYCHALQNTPGTGKTVIAESSRESRALGGVWVRPAQLRALASHLALACTGLRRPWELRGVHETRNARGPSLRVPWARVSRRCRVGPARQAPPEAGQGRTESTPYDNRWVSGEAGDAGKPEADPGASELGTPGSSQGPHPAPRDDPLASMDASQPP
jgi:hypothetical protein